MKKFDKKAGFYFGIGMTVFFIIQNLFALDQFSGGGIVKAFVVGIISGVVAGLLYGLFIGLFKSSKGINQSLQLLLNDGETILFQTNANHFKGAEAVGGRLFLTNARLVFLSHKLNIQQHEWTLDRSLIEGVARYKTLGIVANGLRIQTKGNKEEKFVVEEAATWIEKLS